MAANAAAARFQFELTIVRVAANAVVALICSASSALPLLRRRSLKV